VYTKVTTQRCYACGHSTLPQQHLYNGLARTADCPISAPEWTQASPCSARVHAGRGIDSLARTAHRAGLAYGGQADIGTGQTSGQTR